MRHTQPWIKELNKGMYEVLIDGNSWIKTNSFWEAVQFTRLIEQYISIINELDIKLGL